MENDQLGGVGTTVGVNASTDAASSPEAQTQAVDPIKNLKAEMNRKLSKISERLEQILPVVTQNQSRVPVAETDIDAAPDYKRYVDARFQEVQKDQVKKAQEQAWSQALEMFPELHQESEAFDEKFYKAADKYYGSFDLARDPEAPLKAVKLAALEMGKIDQLAKEKILRDEARRSRIISEGVSQTRESKREKEPQVNERALAKLGISADKLKARMKANQEKYRDGE